MTKDYIWRQRKRLSFFGLPWTFTVYTLSKDRLFIQTGFLNQKEIDTQTYRIRSVSMTRTLGQRIFGLGTIHIVTADHDVNKADIINIKEPNEFKELLEKNVEAARKANRTSVREVMGDPIDDDDDDYDMNPDD